MAEKLPPGKIQTDTLPDENVLLSFKYYEVGEKFCLSKCNQNQVRIYKDCVRMMTSMTWNQVLQTASKGEGKTGLAFTPYEDSALQGAVRPVGLNKEFKISAVRASQKMRIFGSRHKLVYFVLWYDRNHKIVPLK